ncbi:MAG: hypothetical protein HQK96_01600 [Nitrospirae bacterium]|nr:hypothetical protein [Nitrospirota bacterium]
MNFKDISAQLQEARIKTHGTLNCCEYDELGLNRQQCMNALEDEVAKFWGFTEADRVINEHGWVDGYDFKEIEMFEVKSKGFNMNEVTIGKAPNGMYAMAYGASCMTSGFGGPLRIFCNRQYDSRLSAIEDGFRQLVFHVNTFSDGHSNWETQKKKIIKTAIEQCQLLTTVKIEYPKPLPPPSQEPDEQRLKEITDDFAPKGDGENREPEQEITDIQDLRVEELKALSRLETKISTPVPKTETIEQLSLFGQNV